MMAEGQVRRPGEARAHLRRAVSIGAVFGAVTLYLVVVGLFLMFHHRWIIVDVLSLGQTVLIAIGLANGITVARRIDGSLGAKCLWSCVAGAIPGILLALLVVAMQLVDLRSIFITLSPELFQVLTFNLGLGAVAIPLAGGVVAHQLVGLLRDCEHRAVRADQVLPDRFLRIRHYGLLANRDKRKRLAQCRELLGARPPLADERIASGSE